MIKAVADKDGKPIVILGLSFNNLRELKKGRPIRIHMSELGLKGKILIFAGKTERAMETMIKSNFSVDCEAGSTCPKCEAGLREDGSCDCKDTAQ